LQTDWLQEEGLDHNLQQLIWNKWNGTMNWLVLHKGTQISVFLHTIAQNVEKSNGSRLDKIYIYTSKASEVLKPIGLVALPIGIMKWISLIRNGPSLLNLVWQLDIILLCCGLIQIKLVAD
jgi:hypothetical protein